MIFFNNINMKNIIILGHINSGKTTIAKYISKKYNYNHYALGDGVKYFVHDLYNVLNILDPNIKPIPLVSLYSKDKNNYRSHLQLLSTELVKKDFGQDIWIKYLDNKIDISRPYIIDDVRFKNEYEHYHPNAISIKVYRNDEIYSSHCSEHELDDVIADYTINNNHSVLMLYEQIDKIMNKIQNK